MKGVAITVYGMKIEVKLTDLGGQRCRIEGFYVDGKRTIPHPNFRYEAYKQVGYALLSDYAGKYELVDYLPALRPEKI